MILYVILGALMFIWIEKDYDLQLIERKAKKIADKYEEIWHHVKNRCGKTSKLWKV